MIMQIRTDGNDVVTMCSIGGRLKDGIDVKEIPDEVMSCPSRYKYKDGEFIENSDFALTDADEPTFEEEQEEINLDFDYRITCLELGLV